MMLQPIAGWWLILPLIIGGLGYIVWILVQQQRKHKPLSHPWLRRAGLLICLGLMVIGISIPGGTTSPGIANIDVLFAVDTTASMGAVDYAGTKQRIEGVKNDLMALGDKLKGAHLAIVTFDSNVEPLLPSTTDYGTYAAVVQNMTPELFNTSNGSSIDLPKDQLATQLKNSKAGAPDRSRLLFFLSDGEQTSSKKEVKSYAALKGYLDGGAVLGYGTSKGAKMIKNTGFGTTTKDPAFILTPDPATKKFVPATSKFNQDNLKTIATQLNIPYSNRNQGGSVDSLLHDAKVSLAIDRSKHITHYINIYWLFALPFTVLLLWEYKRLMEEVIKARNAQHKKAKK